MKRAFLLTVSLLALPLLAARADLHIATNIPTDAGEPVLQLDGSDSANSNVRFLFTAETPPELRREVGQMFVAPSDLAGKAACALQLAVADAEVGKGARGGEIELVFYHLPGGDLSRREELSTQAGALPATFAPHDALYIGFDPVALQPGETYLFMLRWRKPAARQLFNLKTTGRALATEGHLVIHGVEKGESPAPEYRQRKGNLAFTLYARETP